VLNSKTISALITVAVITGVGAPALADGLGDGSYVKFEFGSAFEAGGDAFWRPPGFPADPQVFFDLSRDNRAYVSAAVGHEWSDKFRGDVSLSVFGGSDFSGPWSRTVPMVAGPHADITGGSVSSTALMANGYWSPFGTMGDSYGIQPFLTAGLGVARNKMSDWTRTNAAAPRVNRTFEGASNTDFAWSIGAGVSANLNSPRSNPVLFEATYRYFDLGDAIGSGTPLPGNGASTPVTPLTYQQRDHVVSIGIRIPLGGN